MLPTLDELIVAFDKGLRTVFAPAQSLRPVPGEKLTEAELTGEQRAHAAALMRVNHVGEVCAQALYLGQALTARTAENRSSLERAAREEADHLAWTAERVRELGGRLSLLNPLWYAGSLGLGLAAGMLGDRWNLAFLAETELQVEQHLEGHLDQLSPADARTRKLLETMRAEESAHRATAIGLGAAEMPAPARLAMRAMARAMTSVAYRF